jgi:hypothetical protein
MIGMRKRLEIKRAWGRWEPALWAASLALVALAFVAKDAHAQQAPAHPAVDLVGTVVNQAGKPLVGAFVSVTGDDWGSLTDAHGRFTLPKITPGTVSLTAEQLGYDTLTVKRTVEAGVPVTLTMTAKPILLQGLKVVVNRFERRRLSAPVSVQFFGRDQLATSAAPDMFDFMQARAGIWMEPCAGIGSMCVYRRGRFMEPYVYIDEMPVLGGMDFLDTMRPSDLYMVEVYAHGAEIRAYTTAFMTRAAETRLQPISLLF